jgi:decaprenyl-phosphate phosphoribosyltransferase
MRPEQYVKGVAILIGAAASGLLFKPGNPSSLALTFVVFSLTSSAVYILNDLRDIEADRMHPRKMYRPLASGQVSKLSGLILSFSLLFVSVGFGSILRDGVKICLVTYVLINVFYSLGGKNLVVLELLIVASGFVLRGLAGVYSVGAEPSMWFNLLALFASLLLVSGKRLAEKNNSALGISSTRLSVQRYSAEYLISLRTVSISGLLMTYFLMIESKIQGVDAQVYAYWLQASLLPFIFCVLSLGYFLSDSDMEEPHTLLLKYKSLFFGGLTWVVLYGYAIYGVQV